MAMVERRDLANQEVNLPRLQDGGRTFLRLAGIITGIALLALGSIIAHAIFSYPIAFFAGLGFVTFGLITGVASHLCQRASASRLIFEILSNASLNFAAGPFLLGFWVLRSVGILSQDSFLFPERGELFLNFTNMEI